MKLASQGKDRDDLESVITLACPVAISSYMDPPPPPHFTTGLTSQINKKSCKSLDKLKAVSLS